MEVTEREDGLIWEADGEIVDVVNSPWGYCKHCIRHWLRKWLLRQAESTHRNLVGASRTDIRVTTKLLRKGDFPDRQRLCALLADGVWTAQLHHKIGWRDDPACHFCGACVDVRHILHECEAWQHIRKQLAVHSAWLAAQPNAVRLCLHCPIGAPAPIAEVWHELQREGCEVLRERDRRLDAEGGGERPDPKHEHMPTARQNGRAANGQWVEPTIAQLQMCQPLAFAGAYPDGERHHKWMFSREQWHRLSWYFTKVQIYRGEAAGTVPSGECP